MFDEDFSNDKAIQEFKLITSKTSCLPSFIEDIARICPSALVDKSRNRYLNVLPVSQHRVPLKELCECENNNYINASRINFHSFQQSYQQFTQETFPLKFHTSCDFIATQAPLPNTFSQFYQMVWENNVPLVVMLTKMEECGRKKADQYWPSDFKSNCTYGAFTVELISQKRLSALEIKTLRITHCSPLTNETQSRDLVHLHFTEWNDFKTPDIAEIRETIRLMEIYKQSASSKGQNGPVLTHCSAGIGRVGCFVALSFLLEQQNYLAIQQSSTSTCLASASSLPVLETIMFMRERRYGMVQTEAQYQFIYQVLQQASLERKLAMKSANIHILSPSFASFSCNSQISTPLGSLENIQQQPMTTQTKNVDKIESIKNESTKKEHHEQTNSNTTTSTSSSSGGSCGKHVVRVISKSNNHQCLRRTCYLTTPIVENNRSRKIELQIEQEFQKSSQQFQQQQHVKTTPNTPTTTRVERTASLGNVNDRQQQQQRLNNLSIPTVTVLS